MRTIYIWSLIREVDTNLRTWRPTGRRLSRTVHLFDSHGSDLAVGCEPLQGFLNAILDKRY